MTLLTKLWRWLFNLCGHKEVVQSSLPIEIASRSQAEHVTASITVRNGFNGYTIHNLTIGDVRIGTLRKDDIYVGYLSCVETPCTLPVTSDLLCDDGERLNGLSGEVVVRGTNSVITVNARLLRLGAISFGAEVSATECK